MSDPVPSAADLDRPTPAQWIARISRAIAACREGVYHPENITAEDNRAATYIFDEHFDPLLAEVGALRERADTAEVEMRRQDDVWQQACNGWHRQRDEAVARASAAEAALRAVDKRLWIALDALTARGTVEVATHQLRAARGEIRALDTNQETHHD